jgi:hypothetical protein
MRTSGAWWNGRHACFRSMCSKERGGSNPLAPTSGRRSSPVRVIPTSQTGSVTHAVRDVQRALGLRAKGLTARDIGSLLGIPRSTVSDWISGNLPNRSRSGPCCPACGHAPHNIEALPPSYSYLLGLYLGDGSIAAHHRGVYRLRLSLDPAYPGIIDEAAAAMREVLPASKATSWLAPNRAVEVYSFSKAWPCLFPQHGPGKKHLRRIELAEWQEELVRRTPELLLRGLIHSDGCRFINTGRAWRHPRYSFTNLSPDIRLIFTNVCDQLGLRWTPSGQKVYVSRKADVARLDSFIGPKA